MNWKKIGLFVLLLIVGIILFYLISVFTFYISYFLYLAMILYSIFLILIIRRYSRIKLVIIFVIFLIYLLINIIPFPSCEIWGQMRAFSINQECTCIGFEKETLGIGDTGGTQCVGIPTNYKCNDENRKCMSYKEEEARSLGIYCSSIPKNEEIPIYCLNESKLKKIYLNYFFEINLGQTVFLESKNQKIQLTKIISPDEVETRLVDEEGLLYRGNHTLNIKEKIVGGYFITLKNVNTLENSVSFYIEDIPPDLNVIEGLSEK